MMFSSLQFADYTKIKQSQTGQLMISAFISSQNLFEWQEKIKTIKMAQFVSMDGNTYQKMPKMPESL